MAKLEKLSRRQLAGVIAGSAAALAIADRAALPQTSDPSEFEKNAREEHRDNSRTLASFDIPMSLEPAFQFRA
jgi:hypothetical protein